VFADVHSCRFWPAVAFDLKNRLPTAQVEGADVPGLEIAPAATGRLTTWP
jgi:hypothetical protein